MRFRADRNTLGGHRRAPRRLAPGGGRRGPGAGVPRPVRRAARGASPAYLAGFGTGTGRPGAPRQLAWGLRDACLSAGVEIHEDTPVRAWRGVRVDGAAHRLRLVAAQRVALATNAFPSLLGAHPAVHRPGLRLRPDDRAAHRRAAEALGWAERFGLSDNDNRFHYYRLHRATAGTCCRRLRRRLPLRPVAAAQPRAAPGNVPPACRPLPRHLPAAGRCPLHPRLGRRIDTCTRFFPFFETAHGGRVRSRPASPGWAWEPRASAPT